MECFTRDNFTCVKCGAKPADLSELHMDHIVPISKGGLTIWDNLQTLCAECNLKKGNKIEPKDEGRRRDCQLFHGNIDQDCGECKSAVCPIPLSAEIQARHRRF